MFAGLKPRDAGSVPNIGEIMCFDQSVVLCCNEKFQLEGGDSTGEPTENISVKTKIPDKLKEPPTKSKEPKANREV